MGVLTLAVCLLAPPGLAAQEINLDIAGAFEVVRGDGFFAFSEDDRAAFADIALGVTVWEQLSVYAEYRVGFEGSRILRAFDTDLTVRAARLGVRYAYPLLPFLRPYATLGAGAYWGTVDLRSHAQSYSDTAFAPGFFVAAGWEAIWYFGGSKVDADSSFFSRLGLGIINDYGYAFGPNLSLDELRAESGPGSGSIDLGELDLSGFTWRLGATLRYRF